MDYDRLLRANLERVFNERDDGKRDAAIGEIFTEDAIMYEPGGPVAGREAISRVAAQLLRQFGPQFRFVPEGPGVGHHGIGTLRWSAGAIGGPVVVRGFDTAEVVNGRIARLWVLIEREG
ncbi:nuclear transport factor 2 family protein [Aquabacterium sp. J223]|uniref:nuclear transport factor 2 family protein n=1 Tax=Aquabacterium sp. J223 TaxID=2898431 RepID=UPI0021AE0774|nr:nuclear transport factor 2 family protein [Aquabacterium sp. J223]UUX94567.1 nuclear transport factor 2 family protein [Aquabacterium sp. J223]